MIATPPRILVVEDEADIAQLIKHTLERAGDANVDVVGSGDAALKSVGEAPPDLVILDLQLANEDGLELLRDLRARSALPIIILSGHRRDEADRVIAVNVGDLSDRETVSASMLGLVGSTLDAMMRANTKRALDAADVVVDVPLAKYGSLDWRKFRDLIREGYDAAESVSARLLPFAVDEAAWSAWREARAKARRLSLISALVMPGASPRSSMMCCSERRPSQSGGSGEDGSSGSAGGGSPKSS